MVVWLHTSLARNLPQLAISACYIFMLNLYKFCTFLVIRWYVWFTSMVLQKETQENQVLELYL